MDCAEAHRARLAARVDLAIRQMESAKLGAGAPDGHDFGVSRRVAGRGDLVPAFRHDNAIAHDHGSEWPALVGAHAFQREVNRAPHKILLAHAALKISWLRRSRTLLRVSLTPQLSLASKTRTCDYDSQLRACQMPRRRPAHCLRDRTSCALRMAV